MNDEERKAKARHDSRQRSYALKKGKECEPPKPENIKHPEKVIDHARWAPQ